MISIEHLSKSFSGLEVLRDISLSIQDEETIAVIGRSGSGKSVLMKHAVGLLTPDSGRVLVDGIDINQIRYRELQKLRRRFGMLFQGGALFDSMNIYDNIAFPLRNFTDYSEAEIHATVQECLDVVQLPDVGPKKPAELSGGMKKRAALARAIALRPDYIIYDEPTSGLDPETSNAINALIKNLKEEYRNTSIVITHDMHSVLEIADRAAFLHEGQIRWVGSVEELHESPDEILSSFVKANEYQIGHPSATTHPHPSSNI